MTHQAAAEGIWPRVAVIGAGAMGAQIAGVIALSGREVALVDNDRKTGRGFYLFDTDGTKLGEAHG